MLTTTGVTELRSDKLVTIYAIGRCLVRSQFATTEGLKKVYTLSIIKELS